MLNSLVLEIKTDDVFKDIESHKYLYDIVVVQSSCCSRNMPTALVVSIRKDSKMVSVVFLPKYASYLFCYFSTT